MPGKTATQNEQQPYAVIVGLDSLPGIQAARILARRGVPVVAIARRPRHYCCRTKVCQDILFADTQTDDFIALLLKFGGNLKHKAVLFPCTDMSVLQIAKHRQELEPSYHIALPDLGTLETLMSKEHFYTHARAGGFRVPRTCILRNFQDVEAALGQFTFPCILKPALRTPGWTLHSPAKVFRVEKANDLADLYLRCSQWTFPLILQEWVAGPDANLFSCNCYFNAKSEPLVTFVARKIRQWPPQAGISCLSEECRNDEVLQETLRLFQQVHYVGLGYVEMKKDENTGEHYVMEANIGRPTVRSAIAEAGGVELLYTMYCDCLGLPLPENRVQQYLGVKWLHLHYDIRSALYYWRRGDLTLKEWLISWRGRKTHALFSWSDPAPFVGDLMSTFVRGFKRLLRINTASEVGEPEENNYAGLSRFI